MYDWHAHTHIYICIIYIYMYNIYICIIYIIYMYNIYNRYTYMYISYCFYLYGPNHTHSALFLFLCLAYCNCIPETWIPGCWFVSVYWPKHQSMLVYVCRIQNYARTTTVGNGGSLTLSLSLNSRPQIQRFPVSLLFLLHNYLVVKLTELLHIAIDMWFTYVLNMREKNT